MRINRYLILFLVIGIVPLIFMNSSIRIIPNNNQIIKNSFDDSNSITTGLAYDNIDPFEDLAYDISLIEYNKGVSVSGDINSLKYKDDNNLILAPEENGGNIDYNISFYFGWESDQNFTQYSDMSYNILLWLDFEVEDTAISVSFSRIYFENETFFDEEISETTISNGYINLTGYLCENTIGFRILENWIGTSKQIQIDRMRIVKMHHGELYPDIIEMTDYQLNELELLNPLSTDFSTDFKWWDNWSSGEIDVRSQETSVSSRWTRNRINISLYLPKGVYNIRRVNDLKLGYFSIAAWIGTPLVQDGSGYWLNTYLTNFTDNKEQHIEEKWFHSDADNYKIDRPSYDVSAWFSYNNITENFKELVQGNLTDFFDYNETREQYYWTFKLDGYGVCCLGDNIYTVYVYHFLDYAYLNVTVKGSGFSNGFAKYPSITNITIKGQKVCSDLDDRICTDDLFNINTSSKARCRNNTIISSKFKLTNNNYESAWFPMSYNSLSGLWETTDIEASIFSEGYYNVWINSTDNEGLSTLNVTTLHIYNAHPIINPDSKNGESKSSSDDSIPVLLFGGIIVIILVASLALFFYIFGKRSKKIDVTKIHTKFINCPYCFKKITESLKVCSYCGAQLHKIVDPAVQKRPINIEEDVIVIDKEQENNEKILIQSANILKIWIFDAKSKEKIYEETLDPEYSQVEQEYVDLNKIINGKYEKNKFMEETIEFGGKKVFINYINFGNPVILIIISGVNFDKNFINLIRSTIKNLDKDLKKLSKNPLQIKQLLNNGFYLFNSRKYNQVSTIKKNLLDKIFKSEKVKNSILSEIPKLPIGTFDEFLKLFEELIAEYKYVETRGKFNNSKYFEEGGYK